MTLVIGRGDCDAGHWEAIATLVIGRGGQVATGRGHHVTVALVHAYAHAYRHPMSSSIPAFPSSAGTATRALPAPVVSRPAIVPSDSVTDENRVADRITAAGLMDNVNRLAAVPRVTGTPEFRAAAEWVMQQAIDAGFDAHIEQTVSKPGPCSRTGQTLFNVVAERRGTAPDGQRKTVIAGAHLDSVPRAPGANDDGSGSSTLIEIARAMRGIDTRNDLRFIWFDGEERGLLGSAAYARDHAADMPNTVAMVNMDMVASPKGTVGYDLGLHTTHALADVVNDVAARHGITATEHSQRHSRSDHASFDAAGVPSIDFGPSVVNVTSQDPNYHSPSDTPDKLNTTLFEQNADLIGAAIVHFADQPTRVPGALPSPPHTGPSGPPL